MALEITVDFIQLMFSVANGTGTIELFDSNDTKVGTSQTITLQHATAQTSPVLPQRLEMTNNQIEFLVPEGTVVKFVTISLADETEIFNIVFDEDLETRTFDTEGYLRINTLYLTMQAV